MRHNFLRDAEAKLMKKVYKDVKIEPELLPVEIDSVQRYDNEQRRLYGDRVLNVEDGTFTPLVFTTTGDIAKSVPPELKSLMRE